MIHTDKENMSETEVKERLMEVHDYPESMAADKAANAISMRGGGQ